MNPHSKLEMRKKRWLDLASFPFFAIFNFGKRKAILSFLQSKEHDVIVLTLNKYEVGKQLQLPILYHRQEICDEKYIDALVSNLLQFLY